MDFRLSLPKDPPPDDEGELELEPLPPDEQAQRNPGRQVNKWGDVVETPPAQDHPIVELYKNVDDIWEEHAEEQDVPLRFSLKQMLWATTAAGVALSLSRWLPPSIAAAVMGVLVLGALILSSQITYSATAQLIWWVMLFVYLLLTIIAIVQT